MRALRVVDDLEPIDLRLELRHRLGQDLIVELAEQGPMEPLIPALRGRLIAFAR